MQDKWIGLLHHVCNVHKWLGGQCDHDEGEHDEVEELQKVILNPELLACFKYYTRFR